MKKADILAALAAFPYSKEDYWVITGGAMVLYGIREETHDIDLGCTAKMADTLEAEGYLYRVMPEGGRWFKLGGDIEVFENWLCDTVVSVDGVPVVSIDGLIAMKQKLGREKDLRDIGLIHEYLKNRPADT